MRIEIESQQIDGEVVCPYCKASIQSVPAVGCSVCQTPHHKACWDENAKCAVFGCLGTSNETLRRRPDWRIDFLFGIILIIFVILEWWAGVKTGHFTDPRAAIVSGGHIYFWSALFLLSYYWRDASWLLRGMMWLCENTSTPRGAWTALLWSGLAFVMGSIAIIQGLRLI